MSSLQHVLVTVWNLAFLCTQFLIDLEIPAKIQNYQHQFRRDIRIQKFQTSFSM